MLFDLEVISIILASQNDCPPPPTKKKASKNPAGYSTRPAEALLLVTSKMAELPVQSGGSAGLQPGSALRVCSAGCFGSPGSHLPACAPSPSLHPNECREGEWRVSVKLL